jgi:L-ornithine N5-oxygenase
VTLIIKQPALKPSDDSPFVNEIFDPDQVDGVYNQAANVRLDAIVSNRATNYGVVRLSLLEHLYEQLYEQRLRIPNSKDWKIRIKSNKQVVKTTVSNHSTESKLVLQLKKVRDDGSAETETEQLAVDAIFVATGYVRNAHQDMLKGTRRLLPTKHEREETKFPVGRNYRVEFDPQKVSPDAGVWLQGCNESTHGVSLLAITPKICY